MDSKTFNVSDSIAAQKKLTEEKSLPHFAPANGVCWACRKNIYTEIVAESGNSRGISFERASTELITGCPHCNRSYCD